MMNTPGSEPLLVVGDSDSLIALLHADDANFARARQVVETLIAMEAQVIFPVSCIAETITTLQRKLTQPALVARVVERVRNGQLTIEPTGSDLLASALSFFDPQGSKQNTFFDALVAATATKHGSRIIFSFDEWYRKLGFQLATDLVREAAA